MLLEAADGKNIAKLKFIPQSISRQAWGFPGGVWTAQIHGVKCEPAWINEVC